ncbi:glycoside hydrolase family protein [Tautonia sociabilis]|uniref:Glycosylase n=1 Tax=Tautonia sociabilis TaxID=2080755 RepID=A0A432MIL1_9BACT|nr:glycosylase [Tautonia sociabilis]RUL87202.1 glycosylase [Tautonia sociabilis]
MFSRDVNRAGIVPLALTLALTLPLASGAWAGDEPFPDWLVRWEPIPQNPLFRGAGGDSWDARIRERGWILREEDGSYKLWYTGYNVERSPSRFLGLATSSDGRSWVRHPGGPLSAPTWVEDMCVLRHDGRYLMFAEGRDDVAHLLTSEDGLRWQERGPLDVRLADGRPIPPGPYGTPTVLRKDGLWHLLYERGDRGVWLATSADLKVWTNVQDDPVLALGPEPYDSTAVAMNQVIERDGVYYGIYHANAHRPWRDWTTCVARSTDLVHWEKYPGNPIVRNNSSSGIFVDEPGGPVLYTMHPEVRRYRHPGTGDESDHR